MVGGHVRLLGREREPRDPSHAAGRDGKAPVPAAHEHDEGGCIHRPRHDVTRDPDPAAVPVHPAAIVEGREAPRRIVDPGPAPRLDPGPVAVAVRRPPRHHGMRHPHGPIVGGVTPVAVLVQVLVADRLARHVARRARVVPATVAGGAPLLPVVGRQGVANVVTGGIGAGDDGGLVALHRERRAGGGDFGFTAPHRHRGRVPGRVHVDAIAAGAEQGHGAVGRVDLEAVLVVEIAQPHAERALRQAHLGRVVVEREEPGRGVWREPQGGRAEGDLRARVGVGPQVVAPVQRVVDRGGRPVVRIARAERHRAAEVAEPPHAARGIDLRSVTALEGGQGAEQHHGCEHASDAHDGLLSRPYDKVPWRLLER